jgi:DNA-binding MarR family transcriptional regulator
MTEFMPQNSGDFDARAINRQFTLQVCLFIPYGGAMQPRISDVAVTDFAQTIGRLVRRARAAGASQDLSWSELSVLKCLALDGPSTTAELARTQGMRPQSMRTIVSALEQTGLVGRKPHATDRRQVNLELTSKGAAVQKSSHDAKRTWLAQSFARLERQERDTVLAAGGIIKRLLDEGQP